MSLNIVWDYIQLLDLTDSANGELAVCAGLDSLHCQQHPLTGERIAVGRKFPAMLTAPDGLASDWVVSVVCASQPYVMFDGWSRVLLHGMGLAYPAPVVGILPGAVLYRAVPDFYGVAAPGDMHPCWMWPADLPEPLGLLEVALMLSQREDAEAVYLAVEPALLAFAEWWANGSPAKRNEAAFALRQLRQIATSQRVKPRRAAVAIA